MSLRTYIGKSSFIDVSSKCSSLFDHCCIINSNIKCMPSISWFIINGLHVTASNAVLINRSSNTWTTKSISNFKRDVWIYGYCWLRMLGDMQEKAVETNRSCIYLRLIYTTKIVKILNDSLVFNIKLTLMWIEFSEINSIVFVVSSDVILKVSAMLDLIHFSGEFRAHY